jgi:subfamily B ATP-binding cassette protein MsbA
MLMLAMLCMMIEGSMLGVISYMMQPMFDDVFLAGRNDALWFVGLGIMAIFIVRALTNMGQRVLMSRIAELTAADLRSGLLKHLMRLDTVFHQSHSPGYLMERVQGDVQSINSIWTSLVTGIARDAVSLIVLFGVAISIDWVWTLIALIGTPLLILPSLIIQRYIRSKSRAARELAGRMSNRLGEVFHGINPIKLNNLEHYQAKRYEDLTQERVRVEVRSAAGRAMIPGFVDFVTGLGFLGIMIYGGGEIIAGEKTQGQFMSFFTAIALAFEPLRRLGSISGLWQAAAASIERLHALFALEPNLVSPEKPIELTADKFELELRDVQFAYGDLPVLNGVSLKAEAETTVALVGASGAGKSTIFNVLTRLVNTDRGDVLINGTPVESLSLEDLRGHFSVVTQDALLFDDSIRENILLGRTDLTDDALQPVLDAASVSEFLKTLPQGLDTPAGPRGSNLSGGQRQRVAIARALLGDTPILLLDEATSALDAQSEAIVQNALEVLSKGRTTLVIAHRLSTVRNADKIVVMDKGRVVDQGTHDALLARGGLYSDLYKLQFSEDEA